MDVWVAAHDGPNGSSILGAFKSEDGMYAGIAGLIRDGKYPWWPDALSANGLEDEEGKEIQLEATAPEDDRQCVSEYFTAVGALPYNAEYLTIDLVEVK